MSKRTAIIGATPNPSRYAFLAANLLVEKGYDIVPLGIRRGEVAGKPIIDLRLKPEVGQIDTITLYIGPRHQPEWYDYLAALKPSRVIFNPGTENDEFETLLRNADVEVIEACTLVMLRTGQY